MITNGFRSRPPAIGALIQFLNRGKWIFTLATAALVTVAATLPPPVSDENTDEEYIRIMNLMDRADALRATSKPDAAKAKDQEAYRALMIFKRAHPKWNSTSVEYRLSQLAQEIEGKPPESEAPSKSKGHTNLEAPSKHASSEAKPSAAVVKLIDAGAEPRKALRLHVKAGDKQAIVLTIKTSVDATATPGGKPIPNIPALQFPADVEVQNVAANGDITYQMTFAEPGIAEESNTPPQMVQFLRTTLSGLKGATLTGVRSDRGVGKKADAKVPSNANAQVRQLVDQIKEGMSSSGSELPEEAVGTGAKWEVKSTTKLAGIPVDEMSDYQLVSVEGDHISTSLTQTQSPANQKMQSSPGAQTNATQTTNQMTGTVASDLSKLMPLQATIEGHEEQNGVKMVTHVTLESH